MLGVLPQVRENIAFFGRRLKIGDSASRPSRARQPVSCIRIQVQFDGSFLSIGSPDVG